MNLVTLRRSQSQQKMAEPPEPKAQKYHVWTGFFAKIPQKVVKSLESFGTLTVLFLEAKTSKKRFFFRKKFGSEQNSARSGGELRLRSQSRGRSKFSNLAKPELEPEPRIYEDRPEPERTFFSEKNHRKLSKIAA